MLSRRSVVLLCAALALLALAAAGVASLRPPHGGSSSAERAALAGNPNLDPGTALSGPAPEFTLTDQFGRQVSLRSFRGRVVILAFNDSECTTICPLTTSAMVEAKSLLGAAGNRVALLGIDANPQATSLANVRAYSRVHEMVHQWQFLTAPLAQLRRVWAAYKIDVAIERNQIDHTPALFVMDPQGRLAKLYVTQQAYSAVGQLGQVLAQEASHLLPDHPPIHARHSYAPIAPITPAQATTLPRVGGGSVTLGPGAQPRLLAFFATWVSETGDLGRHLTTLAGYDRLAGRSGLPRVIGVDAGSVEPSPAAMTRFLATLRAPLRYPLAIDDSGRVADGYQVEDQPWLVLTSPDSRIIWHYDVSTQGPLTAAEIARHVRAALAAPPPASGGVRPGSAAATLGAPAPLADLQVQANQVLGSTSALAARLRALRGYPVVVNAWASWCGPCRGEFSLFQSAAQRFGRDVAFLGVATNDTASGARSFLRSHPVGYPSYQSGAPELGSIVPQGIAGMPTTFFIGRGGKVTYVHTGQYDAQGSLDDDIAQYARGR